MSAHDRTALAIFDIDGTLARSTGIDDECLCEAIHSELGFHVRDTDWGNYHHSTDDGLVIETTQRGLGRDATIDEIVRVHDRFIALLGERLTHEPERCRPIAGIASAIEALREAGFVLGLASGAWPASARLKLRASGLDAIVGDWPASFSAMRHSQPMLRPEIIASTRDKLMLTRGVRAGEALPTLYIGDGVWDARAARALDIGFVGVRCDAFEERLRAEGAERILHDYLDAQRVVGLARGAARVPGRETTGGTPVPQ